VKERRLTEARALLMREVDHRARNALTVVQAIVRLTQSGDVEAFKRVALGRVEALSRAQTSLARRKWEGAYLAEVVEAELAALAFSGASKVSGPATLLPPQQVQAMSMILHELATNAAKYGALGAADGLVTVSWRREEPGPLVLTWREEGGPAARRPSRSGFGSRMVRQLARQLGGTIRFDWRAEGLTAELTVAL
jgi:two-component sensor histidine kinase